MNNWFTLFAIAAMIKLFPAGFIVLTVAVTVVALSLYIAAWPYCRPR